jgi:hypothetical protein
MTELELFALVREIVLLVTGVPTVILADQNAPAPSGPYAAIRPKQSIAERGQANIVRTVAAGGLTLSESIKAQVVTEVSINFYRTGAHDYAEKMKQADKRSDVFAILYKAGVGWRNSAAINNLTSIQADNWEQRSQISIFLMYEVDQSVTVNTVGSVVIAVENEDADLIEQVEVTELSVL